MNPESGFERAVQKAADLLRSAKRAVVLTGAGISTPSGIPDFRSAGSGQWAKNDPMLVASLTAFRRRPTVFFDWLRPLARTSWDAVPNPAHTGLAELERRGIVKAVITQNIDGLHQKAGSQKVLEVHGSMRTATCPNCRGRFDSAEWREEFLQGGIPHCPYCDTIVKPDVVLYEENLPMDVWEESELLCRAADVMVVVGSSLEVIPVAELPYLAYQHSARLIINTFSPTYVDKHASVLLPYDVAKAVPAVAAAI